MNDPKVKKKKSLISEGIKTLKINKKSCLNHKLQLSPKVTYAESDDASIISVFLLKTKLATLLQYNIETGLIKHNISVGTTLSAFKSQYLLPDLREKKKSTYDHR